MKTAIFTAMACMALTTTMASCRIVKVNTKEEFGEETTVTRNVKGFNSIEADMMVDIEYSQTADRVVVIAPEKIQADIKVEVEDSVLNVYLKNEQKYNRMRHKPKIKLICSSPVLKSLELNGAGDITVNHINTPSLSTVINGAGDLDIKGGNIGNLSIEINGAGDADCKNIYGQMLRATINGAGDIELEGKYDKGDFSISGAGSIDISKLECHDYESNVEGVGSIKRK